MALKDDRVEQCLRSCGSEFQMWLQSKRKEKAKSLAFVLLDFQHAKTNASHHDLSEHKATLNLNCNRVW